MKSAINMLEDISGQLTENISLLEFIYRDSPDMGETDNALSCLIRSMLKTSEQAQEYIDAHTPQITGQIAPAALKVDPSVTGNALNLWAADIGNCKCAIYTAIDCMPSGSNSIGVLTIVGEKLDELQEVISRKADKIES